ncbi:hypothetical protein ACH5RR_033614 [Cinchona calisaya]|uniref:Pectinesterase catalytic domain-containing protein n=1 Tax=Cinchona calisaya TaxID=153742 RepID=A0ABD2YQW7_9GENT
MRKDNVIILGLSIILVVAIVIGVVVGVKSNHDHNKSNCNDDGASGFFVLSWYNNLHTVTDKEIELRNWLSVVKSYQPKLKNAISNGLLNASQLTNNAIAIVSTISQIMTVFNIPPTQQLLKISMSSSSSRQRLLLANAKYPSWFSTVDKHLLQHTITPKAVIAKDGSEQYKTIVVALAAYLYNLKGKYVIYVKQGVYDEYITITKDQVNVFMYEDGPAKHLSSDINPTSMVFLPSRLLSLSDKSTFYNSRMDGYQDTLYAQVHRQFYRNCIISGIVEFIFGNSTTLIQNCLIIVRRPMDNQQSTITAHEQFNNHETIGIVIQNCRIVHEQKHEPLRFQILPFWDAPRVLKDYYCGTILADLFNPPDGCHELATLPRYTILR